MAMSTNPPLEPYTPTPSMKSYLNQPDGTKFLLSAMTGNIIMTRPDGTRRMYTPASNKITPMVSDPSFPPPSPRPSTVNDRPPLIDDMADEDDRDLAQLITNITFKGSMTPQEIVALIRDQGWVPGADYQRATVKLRETEDKLYKLQREGVFPSEVPPERSAQADMRIVRGGRMAGKTTFYNHISGSMDEHTLNKLASQITANRITSV